MLFDDLETDPPEWDEADAAADAFFETPGGMKQQIASLQQHNGILVAQHERMEALIKSFRHMLPAEFVNAATAGFYELVDF